VHLTLGSVLGVFNGVQLVAVCEMRVMDLMLVHGASPRE